MVKNSGGEVSKKAKNVKRSLIFWNWIGFGGFIVCTLYRWLEVFFDEKFGYSFPCYNGILPGGWCGDLALPMWCNIVLTILLLLSIVLCLIGLISSIRSIIWLVKYPKDKRCAVFVSVVAALAACLIVGIYLFN